MALSLSYDEFVVVAEEQWKIHCDKKEANTKFSTRIGNYEWHCTFKSNLSVFLECQEMIDGIVKEMHIEVIGYYLQNNQYCRINQGERTLLKGNGARLWYSLTTYSQSILLIIRILKDRSEFPPFTAPNSVGNFSSDVKLRFGEHVYHANKQLLSMFSPVFDRMFNGDYKESKQDEIELKNVEGLANPKAFEDGLLALCYPGLPGQIEVFPNSQNVADLLVLAQYFQVDLLKKKCERLLELCREMDILDRILLAKKFGLKELQAKLVKGSTLEESHQIILALLDASEQ